MPALGETVTAGLIALTMGCHSSPTSPNSMCVTDWVVPAEAPVYDEPLDADAPKILWSLSLPNASGYPGGGPILAGDKLALTTADQVLLISKDGRSMKDVTRNLPEIDYAEVPWSAPTADPDGNLYFVGQPGIGSLTADGELRWVKRYPGKNPVSYGEGHLYVPSYFSGALSTAGVFYAVASDKLVHALRSQDGEELWSAPAPIPAYNDYSYVLGGGGNHVMFHRAGTGTYVLDAATGSRGGSMGLWCNCGNLGCYGFTIANTCGSGDLIYKSCPLAALSNGSPRGERTSFAHLIAPGERLVMFDFALDRNGYQTDPRTITLYNRDGSIAAGPAIVHGSPSLVGADGTLYAMEWTASVLSGAPCALRIIAYARDLLPAWQIDVPSGCRSIYGEVLDRDGTLYISTDDSLSEAVNLYAIQTRSPGLARSSWPCGRGDNQGTQWMVPPTKALAAVHLAGASIDGGRDANPDGP